jgi:glycosyltransferase involved in cell wall biosynthesis
MNERILVVVPFAFHRESGSSLSSYYRVMALTEIIDYVDVVTTPHGKDIELDNLSIIRSPSRKLFQTYQPGAYKKRLVYEFFLLIKTIVLLFRNDYRAVIIHGSSIYWAFWLQIFYKTPFVAMVHGNIQVELEKWGISSKVFLKKIASKIENRIINTFSNIIAEHDTVKTILQKAGIREDKISLVKICVKSANSINLVSDNNIFTILYAGTFVKIQNLDLLYQTAQLIARRNIKFIVVGGIEEEIIEEYKIIDNYNVREYVQLVPRTDQKNLMEYYQMANIVVSPRKFGHDTPMKIFDYMNYGKCVLAVDRPIHTGILNHDIAFLTEPTAEAFAEKILHLTQNPQLICEKEEKAKQFFEDNFEFNRMVDDYKHLVYNL